jgi:hypothetical protein
MQNMYVVPEASTRGSFEAAGSYCVAVTVQRRAAGSNTYVRVLPVQQALSVEDYRHYAEVPRIEAMTNNPSNAH